MTIRTMTITDWVQTVQKTERSPRGRSSDVPNGYSPGGAAAELGISRQAVMAAINEGRLSATRVEIPGRGCMWFVDPEAIANYTPRNYPR